MKLPLAILFTVIILLIIIIIGACVLYEYVGWASFSYVTGDNPSWSPAKDSDIFKLRFKNCMFTVSRSDGVVKSVNVAPVLNSMSTAFTKGTNNPTKLQLIGPLNPFSFIIAGFNDRASVPDPIAFPWCTSPQTSCSIACPGLCDNKTNLCVNCPGEAKVTLTGKVRTL